MLVARAMPVLVVVAVIILITQAVVENTVVIRLFYVTKNLNDRGIAGEIVVI